MRNDRSASLQNALVAPGSKLPLKPVSGGMLSTDNVLYKPVDGHANVIDFIQPDAANQRDLVNLQMYNTVNSVEIYRNFLSWLFQSFDVREYEFRAELLAHLKLKPGMRVLIVSCGLGEDIPLVSQAVGPEGEIHAQDISKAMVLQSARINAQENTLFTISNALDLPYASGYFDAVFHFGGINLFGDMARAISELDRVCKKGGRVVFGDEGIAAHLRKTEYFAIATCNNKLWALEAPMDLLPHGAQDVQLNYVLGNCFYVIGFLSGKEFPMMNIDVPHKGTRGGSARTRFFGQLEGVSAETKAKVYAKALESNISVHDWLEQAVNQSLKK